MQLFVMLNLMSLNGFFASIIARIRLMYRLFVHPSARVLSKRDIQLIFWGLVAMLTAAYIVVAMIPAIMYLWVYRPVCWGCGVGHVAPTGDVPDAYI